MDKMDKYREEIYSPPHRRVVYNWLEANGIYIIVNRRKDYLTSESTLAFIEEAVSFFERIDGLWDADGFNEE